MTAGTEDSWLEGDGCSNKALMSEKHEKLLTQFGEFEHVNGVIDGAGRDAAYEEFASTVGVVPRTRTIFVFLLKLPDQ
jgi:hypothetical protein